MPGLLGRRQLDLALYRQRDLTPALADPDEPILLVESESSVDALTAAGFYATTWAAAPPARQLAHVLGDHPAVVMVPDNDPAGIACATRIVLAEGLDRSPIRRTLLGEPGEDARDLLNRVGADQLRALVAEALASATPGGSDAD